MANLYSVFPVAGVEEVGEAGGVAGEGEAGDGGDVEVACDIVEQLGRERVDVGRHDLMDGPRWPWVYIAVRARATE